MLTTHKISAELYFESFELLAFHTALEDYAMAYALNKSLKLQLQRAKKDISLLDSVTFTVFEWIDELSDNHWMLFKNKSKRQQDSTLGGLFDNDKATYANYLVTERKEVDFFLKIQTDESNLVKRVTKEVNKIPEIITAYMIDAESLQSRKNLIL